MLASQEVGSSLNALAKPLWISFGVIIIYAAAVKQLSRDFASNRLRTTLN